MNVPQFGLGTYRNTDPETCATSVATAVDLGYRHVDTAQGYDNESFVGDGLDRASVDREEVFVASKIATSNLSYVDAVETTRESAAKLGVDTIDLMYVHWPLDTYDPEETTRALNDLYDDGVIAAAGLSNFRPDQLEEALANLDVPMVAHQVECHPLLPQEELRASADEHGHELVAYCPIARNQVSDVPELQAVAEKHDATPAQVSLAWVLAQGVTVIPKATSEAHIRENWAARDLDLDEEDLARIDGIEERRRLVDFDGAPWSRA